MGDVVVVKAAQHVQNGVGLADIGQELVAESLTFRGPFHQSGDIHNLDCGGHCRLRLAHLYQTCQSVVGHSDDAHIGLDRAEGEVG